MTSEVWVGQLDRKTLVFDPTVQFEGCPHVFLWNLASGNMEKFVAAVSRASIKKSIDAALTERAIRAYEEWRDIYSIDWLSREKAYYDVRLAKEDVAAKSLEERHKQRLGQLGLPYVGVRRTSEKRTVRTAHCYACRANLDNSVQLECVVCGWILCQCGACGCGYLK